MTDKTYNTVIISLFTALLCISSQLSIPFFTIPFTMQIYSVFLSLLVLGVKRGMVCILIYMLLGFIGLPVFSGFRSGPGILLGATGGYIIGFLPLYLSYGLLKHIIRLKNPLSDFLIMFLSLCVCYIFGTIWYLLIYRQQALQADTLGILSVCVFPYVIPDIVKILLAQKTAILLKRDNILKH